MEPDRDRPPDASGRPEPDESVLWYAALGHLIDEVVFVHREDRSIAFVSPSVEHVLGYTPAEFTELATYDLIHPDDFADVAATAVWLRDEPGRSYRSTFRARRADGEWLWVEAVGRNLLAEPGVRAVVNTIRDISERRSLEMQLSHQATHDGLTDLANRSHLLDHLEATLRSDPEGTVAVLYLDLDGFKTINDEHGHLAGDQVLAVVGDRLRSVTRSHDLAGRIGGDEFAVICRDVADLTVAREVAERCLRAVSGPTTVDAGTFEVRLSIGVAHASRPIDADALLHAADIALYDAKRTGRGRVVVAS